MMHRFVPNRSGDQRGFTILELLIATSVFSVMLLVLAAGVISFTNDYFRGITANKTQVTARSIMNDVSQAIEFGQAVKTKVPPDDDDPNLKAVCVDNVLYSFRLGDEVVSNPSGSHQATHAFTKNTGDASDCSAGPPVLSGRELLGDHMRLSDFSVNRSDIDHSLYTIHLRIVYGDDDLLTSHPADDWSKVTCKGGQGSQFCAVSDLTTTVQNRFNGN